MFQWFKTGKEHDFYQQFQAQADSIHQSALTFQRLIDDAAGGGHLIKQMDELDRQADELKRKLYREIYETFITPMDKEDLDEMTHALHRVSGAIHGGATRYTLYKMPAGNQRLREQAALLVKMTGMLKEALVNLNVVRSRETLLKTLHDIHQAEGEADALLHRILAEQFNGGGHDVIKIIQWKEIYEWIEEAFDRAEHVANVLERVVVKYA